MQTLELLVFHKLLVDTSTLLAQMVSSVCRGALVKGVWATAGGGCIMIWECMCSSGTRELGLSERNMDFNTILWHSVAQHDALPGLPLENGPHCSFPLTKYFQDDCFSKEVKVCEVVKHLSVSYWAQVEHHYLEYRMARCLISNRNVTLSWWNGRGYQRQPVQL